MTDSTQTGDSSWRSPAARAAAARAVVGWLSAGLATYLVAVGLARLSGTALWLPREWRESIGIFSAMIGMGVFQLAQMHVKAMQRQAAARPSEQRDDRRPLVLAIVYALSALGVLLLYMQLRGATVRNWDLRQWYETELKLQNDTHIDLLKQQVEIRRLQEQVPGAATLPTITSSVDPKQGGLWGGVPDFIDLARQEIYLPLWYPSTEEAYLNGLAADFGEEGITYALKHEPDRVIDWLGNTWRTPLNVTSGLFLVLHTMIIICFAAGFSYSYGVIDGLVDLLKK